MKKFLFTLALTFTAGAAMAQNNAIYKAQEKVEANDLNAALQILEGAMVNPKTTKFAEIYNNAAEIHARIFNPELMKAAQNMPFDTLVYCEHLDKAIDCYTKSHEADIKPDEKGRVKSKFIEKNRSRMLQMLDYYNYAGVFMNQSHNLEKSLEYFEKYYNMPKNPVFTPEQTDSIYKADTKGSYRQTAFNVTYLNYQLKRWADVRRCADVALEGEDNLRDLYILKMQACTELGDSAAWLATLKEGAARIEDAGFLQNLLYYYVQKDQPEEAKKMADELLQKNPDGKAPWYMKGCVELNMTKDYSAARECFSKALAIDPDYVDACINMGYTYMNEVYSKKVNGEWKLDRKNVKQFNAEFEQIKKYYEEARPYFEHVRELKPDEPKYWASSLQMIYTNLQMPDQAKEMDAIIESMNK